MSETPYSRRSRLTRRGRLVRSAGILVLVIIVLALIVGKLGGSKNKEPGTPIVAFVVGSLRANQEGAKPGAATTNKDQAAIKALLDDWFQNAFVDPKKYGDGTFSQVAAHFAKDAQTQFKTDIATMTIGDARQEVKRVVPDVARTAIGLYYANGKPTFATARVTFSATATLKEKDSLPLRIVFTGDLDLQKQGNTWIITYYTAKQSQNSVQPTPTVSASS